jgi:hypothetical protein
MFVQGFGRFPHFVTFGTTVGLGVHSQILDVAEVAAIEVQVHGICIGMVGTLYQLSYNIGLVVILIITFYESVHVTVQFELGALRVSHRQNHHYRRTVHRSVVCRCPGYGDTCTLIHYCYGYMIHINNRSKSIIDL